MRILTLPGWQGSGPGHWQARWERLHGDRRVEQSDWMLPRRGDWMARLEEVLLHEPQPTVLVAHSLGCHLVAAWAAHSQHAHLVQAALLVAPPDVRRDDLPPQLYSWRAESTAPLPFRAMVIASTDDPYASLERTEHMARDWGASLVVAGASGHLNGESGLGDWPEGRAWLNALLDGE